MNNIFDELSYANKLLSQGPKHSMYYFDLRIVAKYYRYLGKNENQIRDALEEYCLKFEPYFNSVQNSEDLDRAVKATKNNIIRTPKDVPITQKELQIIQESENYKYRKILFTMLVMAKYYKMTDTRIKKKDKESQIYYYLNCSFLTIIRNAHVYLNKKDREFAKGELAQLGYIEGTRYGFKILFTTVPDNLDVGVVITDMNNITKFLPWYCKQCGKKIEKRYKHEMCSECYDEYRKKQIKSNFNKYITNIRKNIIY